MMLIKCISKYGKDLPAELINSQTGFTKNTEFDLEVNQQFKVYALVFYSGYVWYCICPMPSDKIPFWYPSPLFVTLDNRMSRYWVYSTNTDEYATPIRGLITFPEWANDPSYYDYLVDREKIEVEIFKKYKLLMDIEFPDPEVTEKATALEDGWAMCPTCIDAWQPNPLDGMTVCPICNQTMHNPYYRDFFTTHQVNSLT